MRGRPFSFLSLAVVVLGCRDHGTSGAGQASAAATLTSADVPAASATSTPEDALPPVRVFEPAVDLAGNVRHVVVPPTTGERVAAIAMETRVYAKPDTRSTKLGYLRAGAVVASHGDVKGNGCAGGFAKIDGGLAADGYVCLGDEATHDLQNPIVLATTRRPDPDGKLPYIYGTVTRGGPVYARLPDNETLNKTIKRLRK